MGASTRGNRETHLELSLHPGDLGALGRLPLLELLPVLNVLTLARKLHLGGVNRVGIGMDLGVLRLLFETDLVEIGLDLAAVVEKRKSARRRKG